MEEAIKCLSKKILKLERKQKPYIDMLFLPDYMNNETVALMIEYYNHKIVQFENAIEKLKTE